MLSALLLSEGIIKSVSHLPPIALSCLVKYTQLPRLSPLSRVGRSTATPERCGAALTATSSRRLHSVSAASYGFHSLEQAFMTH